MIARRYGIGQHERIIYGTAHNVVLFATGNVVPCTASYGICFGMQMAAASRESRQALDFVHDKGGGTVAQGCCRAARRSAALI